MALTCPAVKENEEEEE